MYVIGSRESTRPPWRSDTPAPPSAPLETDLTVDVCVVGAGIAGSCVAYQLAEQGHRVAVLDDGAAAGGETGRSTAHATCALDDRYYKLETSVGAENARMAAESHNAAIVWYEQIAERMEFGFARVDGYLVVPEGRMENAPDLLGKELGAALRAGVDAERLDALSWAGVEWGPALRFPRQAQLNPLAVTRQLLAAAREHGTMVHLGTHVTDFHGGKDAHVVTDRGRRVSARHVVVATNTPVNDRLVIHTKQGAYRTYAIAVPLLAEAEAALVWDGLWEDDTWYHYVRVAHLVPPGGERATPHLIVGGEDHKTGQEPHDPPDRYERLEEWTRKRFGPLGPVSFRWSGQIMEPADGMGFIGRNPMDADNVYIVTGDSGNGITHGAAAGMLIPDLIAGRENPWEKLYDPSRTPLRRLGQYVMENANAFAQYKDWVAPGEVKSEHDIPRGCGAIVADGVQKLAVFRDDDGAIHRCSATCPHLGGVVRWNSVERTWDCPLHGSRFEPKGQVVNGPANTGLETREIVELPAVQVNLGQPRPAV